MVKEIQGKSNVIKIYSCYYLVYQFFKLVPQAKCNVYQTAIHKSCQKDKRTVHI